MITQYSALSDMELLTLGSAGSQCALQEFVRRYALSWKWAARRQGISDSETDDVIQEGLLKVLRYLSTFHMQSKVSTWVYKIMQNCAIDYRRRLTGRPSYSAQDITEFSIADDNAADFPDRIATRLLVHQALESLPTHLRLVIELMDLEAWSLAETAQYMRIPEGTVKSRRLRARGVLREYLSGATVG